MTAITLIIHITCILLRIVATFWASDKNGNFMLPKDESWMTLIQVFTFYVLGVSGIAILARASKKIPPLMEK